MKTVIIVSKCLTVTKMHKTECWYHFHFKGVYAGVVLKKVILKSQGDFQIKKGEEYLLYVGKFTCSEGVLKGEILRAKLLDKCWDKS